MKQTHPDIPYLLMTILGLFAPWSLLGPGVPAIRVYRWAAQGNGTVMALPPAHLLPWAVGRPSGVPLLPCPDASA